MSASAAIADERQAAFDRQAVVGIALALAVMVGWLAGHVYAVWFLDVRETPLLAAALFAWQTWLSVGLFIIAHDCMHGSLAPLRPAINRWFGRVALRLYMGFSFDRMIAKHHAHHRHSGTAGDPDFDENHPTDGLRWYWTFMWRYLDWYVFWVTGTIVVAYVSLLTFVGGPERGMHILFWAGPSLVASMQLFYFGTFRPHRHEDDGEFADTHNSRSNDFPVWASLLTCFHFGYHHEHHDNPHVPWWRLPAMRREVLGQQPSGVPA